MADPIKEAQELYADAMGALGDQRRQVEEDLSFSDPSDPQQWDQKVKSDRENDPGGARPCLVFDQLGQYVANVAGQVEQRPPSLHALPVDGGADKKVAEYMDGFYRQIEYASRAQQHYARALTSAARCGVGYLTVRPTYVNRALGWQEPRLGSEGDPLRVVLDPWSVELDGSDATLGFLLTPFSHRSWDREFGDAEKVSFGDTEQGQVKDDRESINVAEVWRVEKVKQNIIVHIAQDGDETELPEDDFHVANKRADGTLQFIRNYTEERSVVKWSRMSGVAELTKETEYPASGIGIVPVYGYVGWANGRMTYCGIPRRAMSAQREYNYHMSEMHAYMANAPKAPWITPVRAIKGLEKLWDRASVDQRANLPYHDMDETGPIAAPSRPQVTTNLANHAQGAEQAVRDIQAAIGMYQANLGAPSNEQSGVAIDARKEQGEASTAHFPSHLAASIGQAGRLCMEMVPKLIDTRRQIRTLGFDGSPANVTIDPQQAQPMQETDRGVIINPNIGRYDVRVTVGASFTTQRGQAQQAFTEMMRANPDMTPGIAPLWAQTLDIPNADKLTQVFTAMAPPEVKAILNPESDKQPSQADLVAQLEQVKKALQEATQIAEEAQADADEATAKCQAMEADREVAQGELDIKGQEVQIKGYDAETKRMQAVAAAKKAMQDAEMARQAQEVASIQAEHAMDTPEEPEAPEAEPVEQGPDPQIEAVVKGQQAILEQAQQTGALLKELIRMVQAPRKREPVYDKNGEITGSVDKIDLPQPTIQ